MNSGTFRKAPKSPLRFWRILKGWESCRKWQSHRVSCKLLMKSWLLLWFRYSRIPSLQIKFQANGNTRHHSSPPQKISITHLWAISFQMPIPSKKFVNLTSLTKVPSQFFGHNRLERTTVAPDPKHVTRICHFTISWILRIVRTLVGTIWQLCTYLWL